MHFSCKTTCKLSCNPCSGSCCRCFLAHALCKKHIQKGPNQVQLVHQSIIHHATACTTLQNTASAHQQRSGTARHTGNSKTTRKLSCRLMRILWHVPIKSRCQQSEPASTAANPRSCFKDYVACTVSELISFDAVSKLSKLRQSCKAIGVQSMCSR